MSRRPPVAAAAAVPLALALVLAGCGSGAAGTATPGTLTSGGTSAGQQTLTVLAAASLTDVLERVAADFEVDHPGVEVEQSFAASSTIVRQVNEGAPADVIALAGQAPLGALEEEYRAAEPVVFATNTLELVVPADNPAGITGPADLTADGIRLVVCEVEVPCGTAAEDLFDRLGIDPAVASYEPDVRATLTKVELGEADVGVVYRTDVAAAGAAVRGVAIRAADNVTTSYPIVDVSGSGLAGAFVEEVRSERAREHLLGAGFGTP